MRRIGSSIIAAMAATAAAVLVGPAPAHAAPVPVFPGMEIRQDTNVCTLGFVDPQLRVAFTAGHCRGSGRVTDINANFIGGVVTFRDSTPNGATVSTTDMISDYASIGLAPDVMPNNVLPGGRMLVSDPALVIQPGQPVCHFGVVTGESCGKVESVNNGWFTMAHGVVSQKGDSGGPVYVVTPDNRAVIVGLFNSTWGNLPAAITWSAIRQQVAEDVRVNTSGQPA